MNNNLPKQQKRCYYEILGVDRKATQDEIKQSYRKLAVKYHPDKSKEENATQIFQELGEAYQTLSDVNDRTWYDNNRERILLNKDHLSKEDLEMQAFGFDIWDFFSSSCYKGFEDDENGFYTIYRQVFEKIKYEEENAYNWNSNEAQFNEEYVKPPGFGDSSSNLESVMGFYQFWGQFIRSYKNFAYVDEYDARDAENRYVKRQMEKENLKERKKEKKNYLDTIKKLVNYCQNKDPRYKQYTIQMQAQEKEKELRKKEEKKLKDEEDKFVKLEQKLQQKRWEEERWRENEEQLKRKENGGDEEQEESKYTYIELDYYCEICQKEFKSDNQLINHKQSKNHLKRAQQLFDEVALKEEKIMKELQQVGQKDKKGNKKGGNKENDNKNEEENDDDDESDDQSEDNKNKVKLSKKQKRKQKKQQREELEAYNLLHGITNTVQKNNTQQNQDQSEQQQIPVDQQLDGQGVIDPSQVQADGTIIPPPVIAQPLPKKKLEFDIENSDNENLLEKPVEEKKKKKKKQNKNKNKKEEEEKQDTNGVQNQQQQQGNENEKSQSKNQDLNGQASTGNDKGQIKNQWDIDINISKKNGVKTQEQQQGKSKFDQQQSSEDEGNSKQNQKQQQESESEEEQETVQVEKNEDDGWAQMPVTKKGKKVLKQMKKEITKNMTKIQKVQEQERKLQQQQQNSKNKKKNSSDEDDNVNDDDFLQFGKNIMNQKKQQMESDDDTELTEAQKRNLLKKEKKKQQQQQQQNQDDSEESDEDFKKQNSKNGSSNNNKKKDETQKNQQQNDKQEEQTKELNKAKLKKEKRKEKEKLQSATNQCNSCSSNFDSKNKLMQHLKETNHAQKK